MKRRLFAGILFCAAGCAHSGGSVDLTELRAQQAGDLDGLRQEMLEQLRALRAEVASLKESTEEARTTQRDLLAALERRAAPAAPARPSGPDPDAVYAVPVEGSPTRGPEDAWVTIVEVSDFQCPFCQRVTPTIAALRDKYGDDLRVVFRNNPLGFHQQAMPAAVAAMCAHEQRLFWPMHDVLFENQRALAAEKLAEYARGIGNLNFKKWKKCVDEERPKNFILEDQKNVVSLGARGTPSFFINGRFLSGAQPSANFERLIDEELKKAKNSGLARADYYARAVLAKGQKAP